MTVRYKPNVTVACVIQCQDHALMVKEIIDGQIRWNQPAGHLEQNESLIDACKREVLEETGLTVTPQKLIGIYQYSATSELAFLRFTFAVTLPDTPVPSPQDKQIQQACWLPIDQILTNRSQHRSKLVAKSIEDTLNGKQYPLDILNDTFL